MTRGVEPSSPAVACLVFAHNDPAQVRRLRNALDPFPVFLHVDRRTDSEQFAELTEGLAPTSVVQPRSACGWGSFGLVQAELDGYRQVLRQSTAQHIVVMSGADYPLWSTADIADYLRIVGDRSVARLWPLPFAPWGPSGGLARLRYRHWGWRKHMLRLPIPRALPSDVVPSGASVWKIISRRHAQAVLDVVDARPDLVAFWRRSWSSDETFIPTLLRSPLTGIDWDSEHVTGEAWWIGWDGTRRKSPPWLDESYFEALRNGAAAADGRPVPAMFARKVSTSFSGSLLDRIDVELRAGVHAHRELVAGLGAG
jgi:hypothetical protein